MSYGVFELLRGAVRGRGKSPESRNVAEAALVVEFAYVYAYAV